MAWLTIIIPVINTLLDFSIKVIVIVLLCKLIPLIKNVKLFTETKSDE